MPFGDGFNFSDFNTYGFEEWAILGSGLAILIFLLVLLPIGLKRRKKLEAMPASTSAKSPKTQTQVSKKELGKPTSKLVYTASNGEVLIFAGENAWYVNASGKTDLLKAVEGTEPVLAGKTIYLAKDVKKVTVTQEGDEIVKHSAIEKQFVTFDFVSKDEVRLGGRAFLTDKEIAFRAEEERKRLALVAKEQAVADKKAAVAQKKADKILAKEQAKAEKKALKLQKKQAKQKKQAEDIE